MTAILLTVDTELSPAAHQRGVPLRNNFAAAILGQVADGEWGIVYQMRRLNAHGLKAVFFVEALCAQAFGIDIVKRVVELVLAGGHEVQLHVHTEWLPWFSRDPVDGRRGRCIADFSEADQRRLLELGLETLAKCGSPAVAFRAGNYGANNATLRALASLGVKYDSSYNVAYTPSICRIETDGLLLNPTLLEGVVEVPITFFEDYFRNYRPAQIAANSVSELRMIVAQSATKQRPTTVIVNHSFELLNRARTRANRLHVDRFEQLCAFLSERKAEVTTTGFGSLGAEILAQGDQRPLKSHTARTAWRMAEQAIGTLLYERS